MIHAFTIVFFVLNVCVCAHAFQKRTETQRNHEVFA